MDSGGDVDVRHGELAQKLAGLAHEDLGWTVERIGSPPKLLLPYRVERPFKKIATPTFTLPSDPPDAKPHKVEILCDGQQWVAYHIHPDTGRPYHWPEGGLPPRSDLPEIGKDSARSFITRAMELITSYGGRFESDPEDGSEERVSSEQRGTVPAIAEALEHIPNDDLHHDDWVRIGLAIKGGIGEAGWPLFQNWSALSSKDDPAVTAKKWKSFKPRELGAGTVYRLAMEHGWRPAPELILNGAVEAGIEAIVSAGGLFSQIGTRQNGYEGRNPGHAYVIDLPR